LSTGLFVQQDIFSYCKKKNCAKKKIVSEEKKFAARKKLFCYCIKKKIHGVRKHLLCRKLIKPSLVEFVSYMNHISNAFEVLKFGLLYA